jgi:NAD(P)H-dependent FMN reductase
MKKVAIVTCSYNPESKSTALAMLLKDHIENASFFSLKSLNLPFCDGDSVYSIPEIMELTETLKLYDAFIFAVPIYNYSVNAAAKNFIEIFGECLKEKVVGIVAAAGGARSYMSVNSFSDSLRLDFRCRVVSRFVYATPGDWEDSNTPSNEIKERIAELAQAVTSSLGSWHSTN